MQVLAGGGANARGMAWAGLALAKEGEGNSVEGSKGEQGEQGTEGGEGERRGGKSLKRARQAVHQMPSVGAWGLLAVAALDA